MTARWLALLTVTITVASVGYAAARAASGTSLKVRPATIYYRQPKPNATNIGGHLSSGRSGVRVVLNVRRWPFQGSFRPVTSQRTARGGAFNFVQRPSRATQYRVTSAGSASARRTVYVYPGYENARCTWSGAGGQGSCTHAPTKAGEYTMHFSFDYLYPSTAFSQESGLPVFVYFDECFGCSATPSTLQLQRTVAQNPSGGDSAHVAIRQRFSVKAGQAYRWYLAPCLQTTERNNGFGLPGAPGSHHCGSSSVPSRYFIHGRDLG